MPKKLTDEEWKQVYDNGVKNAPLCKCGCKNPVRVPCGSWRGLKKLKRKSFQYPKYIQGHDKYSYNWHYTPTSKELGRIIGTILGDSSIIFPHSRSKNARISANHALSQKLWVEHKCENLPFKFNIKEKKNPGWGDRWVCYTSSTHPSLTEVHHLFYGNGKKKRITREILSLLTDEGLAWWFGDDGSGFYSKQRPSDKAFQCHASLATHSFTKSENELAVEWLTEQGFAAHINQDYRKKKWFIRFRPSSGEQLFERIRPYLPECMQYKVLKNPGLTK